MKTMCVFILSQVEENVAAVKELEDLGMDQETLARHLNLSRTTIINIEKGRQRLSLEHAWLTAKILNISIEELLPSTEMKTVEDWKNEVQKVGVNKQTEKAVIKWISKVKSK